MIYLSCLHVFIQYIIIITNKKGNVMNISISYTLQDIKANNLTAFNYNRRIPTSFN